MSASVRGLGLNELLLAVRACMLAYLRVMPSENACGAGEGWAGGAGVEGFATIL